MEWLMKTLRIILLPVLLIALTACASWFNPYEQPDINVTSISMAPASEGAPALLIGLQIVNPNSRALPISGMAYHVDIDGHRILSGAESGLPEIAAYSTQAITVRATPDLVGSARLLNTFFSERRERVNYTFNARFDLSGLLPDVTMEETGAFSLSSQP